ncbi:hypothetical protein [Noviherbaspirillum sp. ST9]|uniref:hypothetical protein n=1 Tax=Noviherbaspirillum sp. ST9 TaxID=3401606 RepID=UPI003B58897F
MNILLIEDENGFIDRLTAACKDQGITIVSPEAAGLDKKFTSEAAIEQQLVDQLRAIREKHAIDLVLLDTDISKLGNGISQAACRTACQDLGLPVTRYTKKHSETQISHLKYLQRLAVEGASAIWVPNSMTKDPLGQSGIIPWLKGIEDGFRALKSYLDQHTDVLGQSLGPTGILAHALDRPSLRADLLGYTAQNFFFFAPSNDNDEMPRAAQDIGQLATRLGYWLYNYVLAFPGPILNAKATAAFLNITPESVTQPSVQAMLAPARYTGPFSKVEDYFWAEDLLELIEKNGGDIANAPEIKDAVITRVDPDHPESTAYYCMLSREPIKRSEASSNPDWIPSGAQVARIKQDLYDELGPLLSI